MSADRALAVLAAALPDGWEVVAHLRPAHRPGEQPERWVGVRDPAGAEVRLPVHDAALGAPPGIVLSDRALAARVRTGLEDAGVAYADGSGNVWIALTDPPLALRTGPARPRTATGAEVRSLKGRSAARAARVLVDVEASGEVLALARAAGVPQATLFRVVDLEESRGRVERGPGGIAAVDWVGVLEDLLADGRPMDVTLLGHPGGPAALLDDDELAGVSARLESAGVRHAFTGPPVAVVDPLPWGLPTGGPPGVYVDDVPGAVAALGLPEAAGPGSAALVVAPAMSGGALDRVRRLRGLPAVAPSRVVMDLVHGPWADRRRADRLVGLMRAHPGRWRWREAGGALGPAAGVSAAGLPAAPGGDASPAER